jgi:hypothetical protein
MAEFTASRRGGAGCASSRSKDRACNTHGLARRRRARCHTACGLMSYSTSACPNGASPRSYVAISGARRRSPFSGADAETHAHAVWPIEMMERPMRIAARMASPPFGGDMIGSSGPRSTGFADTSSDTIPDLASIDHRVGRSRIGDLALRGPLTRSHRAWRRHPSTSMLPRATDRSICTSTLGRRPAREAPILSAGERWS